MLCCIEYIFLSTTHSYDPIPSINMRLITSFTSLFLPDDMGLGKSLQALITISLVHSELKAEREEIGAETNDNRQKLSTDIIVDKKMSVKTLKKSKINSKKGTLDNKMKFENWGSILKVEKTLGRSLVICPASLTLHWKEEVLKFFPYGDLLVPELYSSTDSADVKKRNTTSDNHLDKNKSRNGGVKNKNKNINSSENENESEYVESADRGIGVVQIASYDSVRRNKNNYFTNQVRM